jgi:hypothetical protein
VSTMRSPPPSGMVASTVTESWPPIDSSIESELAEVQMIYHSVRMSFKPDVSEEQVADGLERCWRVVT